jgi:hypothetical protein
MISLNETDKRLAVLNTINSEGFAMLCETYDEAVDRLMQKLLDPKTSQSDTIILKGIVNESKKLDPRVLARSLVAKIEHRMEKEGVGVVVLKNKK